MADVRRLSRELRIDRCGVGGARDNHRPCRARGFGPDAAEPLLLFFVSVLPFPTKMLGEFAHHPEAERWAVTIYGVVLLAIAAIASVVWRHAVAEHLISDEHAEELVRAVTVKLTPSLWFYLAAIAIGLAAPKFAISIYMVSRCTC
jgi:uncharacterized membrane protein